MKRMVWFVAFLVIAVGSLRLLPVSGQQPSKSRFRVPEGFAVEVAAPPEKTGSLIALTFDSLGRPVVSKERGSPTILMDKDGDGLFETQKVFTDKVTYAQGMWFDGRTLYAIGRGPDGK